MTENYCVVCYHRVGRVTPNGLTLEQAQRERKRLQYFHRDDFYAIEEAEA